MHRLLTSLFCISVVQLLLLHRAAAVHDAQKHAHDKSPAQPSGTSSTLSSRGEEGRVVAPSTSSISVPEHYYGHGLDNDPNVKGQKRRFTDPEIKVRKKHKQQRAYERKKRLGIGRHGVLHPEQSLRWLPLEWRHQPYWRIHQKRLKMLGLKTSGSMPPFAAGQPWTVLQRVEKRRKETPDTPLEQIIAIERAKWDQEMSLLSPPKQVELSQDEFAAQLLANLKQEHVKKKDHVERQTDQVTINRQIDHVNRQPFSHYTVPHDNDSRPTLPWPMLRPVHLAQLRERQHMGSMGQKASASGHTASSGVVDQEAISAQESSKRQRVMLPFDLNMPANEG